MSPYTVLFFSSSPIVLPLFRRLQLDERFKLVGLVCQPDKKAGRDLELQEHEIKKVAEQENIPVYQPERLSKAEDLLALFQADPPDFLLTFSYGQLLNTAWLHLAKKAPLNVHPSLLPKYRGPTPIQTALLHGDAETGLSLMKMSEGMDDGPLAFQTHYTIPPHATQIFLYEALSALAAEVLPDQLALLGEKGEEAFTPQDEGAVTFCKKIERDDGRLDFQKSAEQILNQFRAYTPWPGVFTTYQGKRLKLLDIEAVKEALPPGQVQWKDRQLLIGTLDGAVHVKQVQLEGKNAMHPEQFLLGQRDFASAILPS